MAAWQRLSGPAQEPITLADARAHARLTQSDDAALRRFIVTAREQAEETLNRGLFTQTWELVLDRWADVIYLPRAAPLQNGQSTAPIVQYYNGAGTLTTWASSNYLVDVVTRPARIVRAPGASWPAVQSDRRSAIRIEYVIGWTTVAAIPERIKHGIRMYVAYLEFDREGLEERGASARAAAEACWNDRVEWFDPQGTWPMPSPYDQRAAIWRGLLA
jgi:uncharacterized phiE125 gp8 family phage protein